MAEEIATPLQDEVTITTPLLKQTVVLRGYISGRNKRDITNVYLDDADMVSGGAEDGTKVTVKASVQSKATEKAIEILVLSVDGSSENVIDQVLDMPVQDYDYVVAEINKITQPISEAEKKS